MADIFVFVCVLWVVLVGPDQCTIIGVYLVVDVVRYCMCSFCVQCFVGDISQLNEGSIHCRYLVEW